MTHRRCCCGTIQPCPDNCSQCVKAIPVSINDLVFTQSGIGADCGPVVEFDDVYLTLRSGSTCFWTTLPPGPPVMTCTQYASIRCGPQIHEQLPPGLSWWLIAEFWLGIVPPGQNWARYTVYYGPGATVGGCPEQDVQYPYFGALFWRTGPQFPVDIVVWTTSPGPFDFHSDSPYRLEAAGTGVVL